MKLVLDLTEMETDAEWKQTVASILKEEIDFFCA